MKRHRSYTLRPETAHEIDLLALKYQIRKPEVIEIAVHLYFDDSCPSLARQIRERFNIAIEGFRNMPRY